MVKVIIDYFRIMQVDGTRFLCFILFIFNSQNAMEKHFIFGHTLQKYSITTTGFQYVIIIATVDSPMENKRSNCRWSVISSPQFFC